MKKRDEYDWLEDPFIEKDSDDSNPKSSMSKGSKLAIGIGCAAVVVIMFAVVAVSCSAMFSFMSVSGTIG